MHENDSKPIEAIEFKSIQDQKNINAKFERKFVITRPLLWFTFLILIACSISVFFILPKIIKERQEIVPVTIETQKQEPESTDITESKVQETSNLTPEEFAALKIEAEKLLLLVIKKQDSLQQKSVNRWAEKEFLKAVTLGETGDEHYRKQNFNEAITAYGRAITSLEQIEKQVKPTLNKHLENGEHALLQGEQEAAIYNFEIAKAIDAKNVQTINGSSVRKQLLNYSQY